MEIKKAEKIVNDILNEVSSWSEFASKAHVSPDVQKYIANLHLSKKASSKAPHKDNPI